MTDAASIGMPLAFVAGIVSFLSPCVLPLVPGYVSYVGGGITNTSDGNVPSWQRLRTVGLSLGFVLGFSTVFIALGASASAVGTMLLTYRYELNIVGGIIVMVFGLFMIGAVQINQLQSDFRFQTSLPGGKLLSAYVLGLAFGFGWTPCIGPILGAILTASARETPQAVAICTTHSPVVAPEPARNWRWPATTIGPFSSTSTATSPS